MTEIYDSSARMPKTVQDYADLCLMMIREDMEDGRFTAEQISCYQDLHDYIDANEYALEAEVPFGPDVMTPDDPNPYRLCNAVDSAVDAMIRAGMLR